MIDIVKIIDLHTFALKQAIEQASIEQRKSLVKALFSFYEKLPHFYVSIEFVKQSGKYTMYSSL